MKHEALKVKSTSFRDMDLKETVEIASPGPIFCSFRQTEASQGGVESRIRLWHRRGETF